MSREARDWAWKIELPWMPKLVLLALAEVEGADGRACPSLSRLAAMTGAARRTVIDQIAYLTEAGLLTPDRSAGPTTHYVLHVGAVPVVLASRRERRVVRQDHQSASAPGALVRQDHQSASAPGALVRQDHQSASAPGALVRQDHQSASAPGALVRQDHQSHANEDLDLGDLTVSGSLSLSLEKERSISLSKRNTDLSNRPTTTRQADEARAVANARMGRYREKIQPGARVVPLNAILARLKTFSPAEIDQAIDRFSADRWQMENNGCRGAPWFFKSDARIEHYMNLQPRGREDGRNGANQQHLAESSGRPGGRRESEYANVPVTRIDTTPR